MKDIVLSPIPLDDLMSQIREVVKAEMLAQKVVEEKLLSPADTCKLFSPAISKQTLQSWTVAGRLVRYDMGGRVYYKMSEVIEAAKDLKKYKKP